MTRGSRVARHLAAQVPALLLAWFWLAPALNPVAWALTAGAFAGGFAFCLRLGVRAAAAQAALPAVLLLALRAGLPPWSYLAAFIVCLLLFRNAIVEQVPFYRSSSPALAALSACLPQGARLLEAGCADARLALALAARRPDLDVTALENAWGAYLLARLRWCLSGRPQNVHLACRNFWKEDWGCYDTVYTFLSPAPMERVWNKFVSDGEPESMLISNTFAIPGVAPLSRQPLPGPLQVELLIWRHPHGTC
ncbi:hypothetical protein [Paludibacterium yongneupense]|uniref:hypothetical protein n=1 Tax=Paludibacterium yongneupense TaxID=400061 RepID=UPI0003FD5653|nr:hypothetical protein [Paludibacterium yongneupense]